MSLFYKKIWDFIGKISNPPLPRGTVVYGHVGRIYHLNLPRVLRHFWDIFETFLRLGNVRVLRHFWDIFDIWHCKSFKTFFRFDNVRVFWFLGIFNPVVILGILTHYWICCSFAEYFGRHFGVTFLEEELVGLFYILNII